jgi:hypothetical protein
MGIKSLLIGAVTFFLALGALGNFRAAIAATNAGTSVDNFNSNCKSMGGTPGQHGGWVTCCFSDGSCVECMATEMTPSSCHVIYDPSEDSSSTTPPVKGVLGTIGAGANVYEVTLVGAPDNTGQVKYSIELTPSGGGDVQSFDVPAGVHKVSIEDGVIRAANHPMVYVYRLRGPTDGAKGAVLDMVKTNPLTGEVQNSVVTPGILPAALGNFLEEGKRRKGAGDAQGR